MTEVCFYCNGTGEVTRYGQLPECPACHGVGWLNRAKYEDGKNAELLALQTQIMEVVKKLSYLELRQQVLMDEQRL